MATLIVAPEPQDINVVHTGLRLLNLAQSVQRAGISWDGQPATKMVEGLVFGIWQNVDSVQKLLAVTSAAGVVLPSRGTYRFLGDAALDLRAVLRAGVQPSKTHPSDLLILDESVNQRTGRQMEGTSLVHSTTTRRRVLGHCLLNLMHSGAEVSGFVDFEMKMNKKTKAGYRRPGHPTDEVSRALHTPLRALALALLTREKARGNLASTVVMDSGFLSLALCRRLRRRGWQWIIAGKTNTPVEYDGRKTTLKALFDGTRSMKSAGDAVTYRVFNVVYPDYGPVRAFFVRFIDRHGELHELHLLTSLSKKRASARAVLRKYLRRWNIEVGHRQTKETFNLRGYHGHTLHGHVNFYALVLIAHQAAEAVIHHWNVQQNGTQVKVPTLALRVRLATIRHTATSIRNCAICGNPTDPNSANSALPMGTQFPSDTPPQNMMGCGLR
jgi:hypothetical protein